MAVLCLEPLYFKNQDCAGIMLVGKILDVWRGVAFSSFSIPLDCGYATENLGFV